MVQSINLRQLAFLLPIALILGCIYVAKSPLFEANPSQLSWAITFDLLVTTPFIYFLIIRKRKIPKTTLVPVFIVGIVVASIVLPSEHQYYLSLVKTWFLPFLELAVISYLIFTIRKAFKKIKDNQSTTPDFFTSAKQAAEDILPKGISTAFATELSLFYYGFISWKKRELSNSEYSYHQTTSTRMVLGVFIFLIIIEATAVHLLLQTWSSTTAWILTILSIYGGFQIYGILRSLSKRPIAIDSDGLNLRYGVMKDVTIPLNKITAVKLETKSLEKEEDLIFLSPFKDMEGNNVLIEVGEPMEISGFYGLKKTFKKIALYVDEPKRFVEEIDRRIHSEND